MADLLSQIGDLIYWEAKKDPELWKESSDEPNTLQIAKRMEIGQSTVWRLLAGKRSLKPGRDPNKPLGDYFPKADVYAAVGRLIGKHEHEKIMYAIRNAPPRPPQAHQVKTRPAPA